MYDESDYQYHQEFKRKYCYRYKIGKDISEDGQILGFHIKTTFSDSAFGAERSVWRYDKNKLVALVPSQAARHIKSKFSFVKQLLDSDDGVLLVFDESSLAELADVLHLRKRRIMSQEQRKKAADRLRQHQFKPHTRGTRKPYSSTKQ